MTETTSITRWASVETWFRATFGLRSSMERTMALKERVYASFTGLAIVSALAIDDHHGTAGDAILALAAGIVGITGAGLVAEVIAHHMSDGAFPKPIELVRMVRIALGAITSASLPFLLLVASALGLIPLRSALNVAIGLYFLGLIVIVLVAARRTKLPWTQQLLSVAVLVGAGIVVVLVLIIGH